MAIGIQKVTVNIIGDLYNVGYLVNEYGNNNKNIFVLKFYENRNLQCETLF